MKILRVIPSMNPKNGGPCQGIRNVLPELAKLGITNHVVCLDDPQSKFLLDDPFVTYALGEGLGKWHYHSKLQEWLQKNVSEYDIVIIHGIWLYHSYATSRIISDLKKKRKKTPQVFVMPHGMLDPYFQMSKSRLLKAVRNWVYWKLIEKNVINTADGLLFTSAEEMRLAKNTFRPYNPKKQLNLGYGISLPPEPDVFDKKEFGDKVNGLDGHKYFLFLGRLDPKKGVDLVLMAYTKLKRSGTKLPQLVIAGPDSSEQYGKFLRSIAGDDPDIFFAGMVNGGSKSAAYTGATAFILPSHQENFGIAVAEAMAFGKPVLISNKVNIWEEVLNNSAGIVEDDDLNGTIRLIEKFVKLSPDDQQRMGDSAKRVFIEQYTAKSFATRFYKKMESMQSILSKAPGFSNR